MSGFSEEWLVLREPADSTSRNLDLQNKLASWATQQPGMSVLDLGCGTGSNLRHLAPHLGHGQSWQLVDLDAALLASVHQHTKTWANDTGVRVTEHLEYFAIESDNFSADIHVRQHDLNTGLDALKLNNLSLVTGSALLDLSGENWLSALAHYCRQQSCAVYFVLSYNGLMHWTPEHGNDDMLQRKFNQHQQQDKGLGTSLGPDAARFFETVLESLGFQVHSGDSDWVLSTSSSAMQAELSTGVAQAVSELKAIREFKTDDNGDHDMNALCADWLQARHRLIDSRQSVLRVGHTDLLALPGVN